LKIRTPTSLWYLGPIEAGQSIAPISGKKKLSTELIALISISMYQTLMGQIVIRNIDTAVIEALRRRAAACGTSMEEQARRALTNAVGLDRDSAARRLAEIRRIIGRLEGPSTLDDLRRDRGRDQA
jgi:plasmid stability protein